MRKRMKYGFFVLTVAVVLGLLYYGTRNDAEQSNSHVVPPDVLNSAPSPPDNVSGATQSEEIQVSVEKEPPENPEDQQVEQEPQTQSDATAESTPEAMLKGRRIVLEDGKEIIVIEDVPDSWKTETEVRFDKEGKAHVSHRK